MTMQREQLQSRKNGTMYPWPVAGGVDNMVARIHATMGELRTVTDHQRLLLAAVHIANCHVR